MNNDDIVLYDTGEVSSVTKVTKEKIKTFDLFPPDHPTLHQPTFDFDFEIYTRIFQPQVSVLPVRQG